MIGIVSVRVCSLQFVAALPRQSGVPDPCAIADWISVSILVRPDTCQDIPPRHQMKYMSDAVRAFDRHIKCAAGTTKYGTFAANRAVSR